MLADLELGTQTRVLRPTLLSALVAGVIAVAVAVLLGSPPAAAGIVLGLGVAVLNVRMLGAGVARVETKGTSDNKVVRRILRTRSAARLVLITLLAVGLVLLKPALGIGMVVGLVIFQIAFVANAGRAILSARIL